ncbi:methyltransferase domain-containing protein [Roseobacter sp. HKCCD9010]|uniref:protein-L-isoaspartate O-methyltransferase family protein n=1 Tax=Rhodobacterales TaxID=204455 RepID=UPI00149259DA|nr:MULTISPECIES: protein-L-isoaspartate O-methyltransferase [Rhodobacterales]MBF9049268.1 methyltransferase domain-containing protein [Rhodobacterales bacterium HKCCD4356]NNV11268.1 methyltransferase domain-containing protein [Roseobacter sp. HKCCD7357]NNV15452.1 methyltransferase domain-containing protein [Roseobacter sp. HKCCD8768]NNV24912.1 methyltransferase domain-containing protein [Roseobacter sp. HKCCD8192]NNV29169.1 methyltransferase domain-containing protein [Roseobacter sp. HKCCD9061
MTDFASRRTIMVDTQVRPSDVTKFPIIDAMLTIPREAYMPDDKLDLAYVGAHVDLAPGRVVLDPRVLAKMLDALDLEPGDLVLDIGPGLGYSTAILARMTEAVVAVEEDPTLAKEAENILGQQGVDNAAVIEAPLTDGSAKHGPYDVICIQGAVQTLPDAIIDQLKEGGRIAAIFMDGALGECRIGRKVDGRMNWRMAFNATAPILSGFEAVPSFQF